MYPYPEHFIVRPGPTGRGETIVPLIAVDHLPDWIQLAGVPRELDTEQAVGLINLGLVAGDGVSTYEVRLRADRIRAIMTGHAEEEDDEEPLAPSDSVSEKGKQVGKEQDEEAPTSGPQEKVSKIKAEKTQVKALGEAQQEELDLLTGTVKRALAVETAPPSKNEARAWSDDSKGASPSRASATTGNQTKLSAMQHEDQPDEDKKKPSPEPTLSASRHNPAGAGAAAAAGDHPARRERPIRPHLTEEMRDTRPRRLAVVPRLKDKFLGANPDTVFCRHWCHHGTCKWGWQCRHQHRMPETHEGLRQVGLKAFPTWYLLLVASGGGLPGLSDEIVDSLGLDNGINGNLNALQSHHHHSMAMATANNSTAAKTATSLLLSSLARPPTHPADALLHASPRPQVNAALPHHHHPPSAASMELRLMQQRLSALLAGSNSSTAPMSNRQIKELREQQQQHHHHHHSGQGRANLHTNASVAANAAGLSAASRRQALREAERRLDAPVAIPAEVVGGAKGDGVVGSYEELEGRLSVVGSDEKGEGSGRVSAVREGRLVDVE